ncbi:MAG: poly(A)-specific ribonuclease, partial [Pleopsidium flavum]
LEEHDSIEDARTALRLWRKYEEFIDAGIVERMVEECYRVGREVGFKPPAVGGNAVTATKRVESSEGRETPLGLREADGGAGTTSGPGTPVGRKAGLSAPGREG